MKLTINISTCPNDTFMFDALLHERIDCRGYKFDLTLADIDELNSLVQEGVADISKISYAVYPSISDTYQILRSGSAIGRGNGPLLVSRRRIYPDELQDAVVAIPGEMTTANALLNRCFPHVKAKKVGLFSDITSMIMDSEVDCGVLIHEERFLYADKGLQLIADLGNEWERLTGKMIPLGAIVVKRDLAQSVKQDIEELVRLSIEYAFANPSESANFVRQHAKELDDDTIEKHIDMFVNEYSLDITQEGVEAVEELMKSVEFGVTDKSFI